MILRPNLLLRMIPTTTDSSFPHCPIPAGSSQISTAYILYKCSLGCSGGSSTPAPGIHIPREPGIFRWKPHLSLWHPYAQRVWSTLVEVPPQAFSPISLQNLLRISSPPNDSPSPGDAQDLSHSIFKLLLTPPLENRPAVFQFSFHFSSLEGWKIIQEHCIH